MLKIPERPTAPPWRLLARPECSAYTFRPQYRVRGSAGGCRHRARPRSLRRVGRTLPTARIVRGKRQVMRRGDAHNCAEAPLRARRGATMRRPGRRPSAGAEEHP
jgi:hypothetical protein